MRLAEAKKDLRLAAVMGMRDLRNRYAGSYAGVAWNIGVPLLYSVINVLVFSILMSGRMGERYGNVPFALFYFSGYVVWTLFADVTSRSTSVLREHSYLISKIAFPVWVLPLVPLAAALITQALIFAIVVVLMAVASHVPPAHLPVFVLVWAVGALSAIGTAYVVAALSVYVPDLAQLVPVVLNVMFWLTPILYPPTLVSEGAAWWARVVLMDLNPFYYLTEAARSALIGGPFPWDYLGVVASVSALALASGAFVFGRLKRGFADVL